MVDPRVEIVPRMVIVRPMAIALPMTVPPMGTVLPMEIVRPTAIVRVGTVPMAVVVVDIVRVLRGVVILLVMAGVRRAPVGIVPGLRAVRRVRVGSVVVEALVAPVAPGIPPVPAVRVARAGEARVVLAAQAVGKPGIRRPPARSGSPRGSRRMMGMMTAA